MNSLEKVIHTIVSEYPMVKSQLVNCYQLMFSCLPTRNYQVSKIIYRKGYFYGFHDTTPWSYDNKYILAHKYDYTRPYEKIVQNPIGIGIFTDPELNKFKILGTTSAWNWQQGSSVQWIGNTHKIIFNEFETKKCISKIVDTKGNILQTIPYHIVNISKDGQFGLTYSFKKMCFGMPGYGYKQFKQNRIMISNQVDNSIGILNIGTGVWKSIISLKDISNYRPTPSMENACHFFTHCLFAPNSKRFLFLHRWYNKKGTIKSRLLSSDLFGQEIFIFPGMNFSHLAWKNNDTILSTCSQGSRYNFGYFLINDMDGSFQKIGTNFLESDGHPQVSDDQRYLITDTYPDRCRYQFLIMYDLIKEVGKILLKLKIPFFYKYEKRCDFHPRWNKGSTKICFDSIIDNIRALCIIENPYKN